MCRIDATIGVPVQVLKAFMTEMNQWEQDACQSSPFFRNSPFYRDEYSKGGTLPQNLEWEVRRQAISRDLNEIFVKYCSPRKRPYGRQGSFGYPPEYDPNTEEILEIVEESSRRVIIFTQQHSKFRRKCRYVLIRKNAKWLIDNKKVLLNGKWERYNL
jgi:hypothetical protein